MTKDKFPSHKRRALKESQNASQEKLNAVKYVLKDFDKYSNLRGDPIYDIKHSVHESSFIELREVIEAIANYAFDKGCEGCIDKQELWKLHEEVVRIFQLKIRMLENRNKFPQKAIREIYRLQYSIQKEFERRGV